jgi:PIN domain nuclease of toxin-antitoxin system
LTRYLLDTNIAIFILNDDPRLSSTARSAVSSGPNFLSVASYWEVMVKAMKGNLVLHNSRTWWPDALVQLAASPLLIRPEHVDQLLNLPPIHKDPFDRMLIAQAISEDLTLVTTDAHIGRYTSPTFRTIC